MKQNPEKELRCCGDCGAKPGELHAYGCDVERCPDCGRQRVSCGCEKLVHPLLPWTGEWTGAKECREFGLWCYWGPPWIPCDKDHPGATEDLNRLHKVSKWDADARRFVLNPVAEESAPEPLVQGAGHQFHAREDGLAHCKVCGGAEGTLPTECPGRRMSPFEEHLVYAGDIDFRDGKWQATQQPAL